MGERDEPAELWRPATDAELREVIQRALEERFVQAVLWGHAIGRVVEPPCRKR